MLPSPAELLRVITAVMKHPDLGSLALRTVKSQVLAVQANSRLRQHVRPLKAGMGLAGA